MISFDQGQAKFNFRVVGVALHQEHILLQRAEMDDFWALPGGRVEMGEATADTLAREMVEELNTSVSVERLLWVVENFFDYAGRAFHELGFYYLMKLPNDFPHLDVSQPFTIIETVTGQKPLRIDFRWVSLDELPTEVVYPSFLRTGVQNLPLMPQHVVHTDEA